MTHHRKFIRFFWHFPCLGFLSASFSFILARLAIIVKASLPIGIGLTSLSKFLLDPYYHRMIYLKNTPFLREPDWIAYGTVAKLVYFPMSLILSALLQIQILLLLLSIMGYPMAITISTAFKAIRSPEHYKCIPLNNTHK